MKKLFALISGLLLLLTGCAGQQEETMATTEETKTQGYYVQGSAFEAETDGAVRVYELPEGDYTALGAVGDQLLLIASGETTILTVLTGAEGVPTATRTIPFIGQSLYNGYGYFDREKKQVVFLDAQLNETDRLQLPEEVQGQPVISPDGEEVFYCVGQDIYGIEAERKIARLIKTHTYLQQDLTGCYFEGKLISCQVEKGKTLYVSTETGQTVYDRGDILELFTNETSYLALRKDGMVLQHIVGTQAEDPLLFHAEDTTLTGALSLEGVLGWNVAESGDLTLQFYQISTGKKTAAVTLTGVGEPLAVYPDRWGSCVWILCGDGKTLLRWAIKDTPVTEETVYTGQLFTAENPDEAQLKLCKDRAKTFYKNTGVYVRVWDSALQNDGEHTLVAEHQPETLNALMDQLLSVLKEFPKDFLKKCATGGIRVCLVRSVDGEQKSAHFWEKQRAYIVISQGMDVRSEFLYRLGYFVDSHVLGNSPNYDYWHKQNPKGFVYGAENQKPEYLTGDTRYFTSENAMKSTMDDRSELFQQAMLPDNAEMFRSPYMQKKLTALCKAIRDAWNTNKETEAFLWEQYLNKPIAYEK